MSVGDLVRNIRHPHAGIGVVIMVFENAYAIAVFPDCRDSEQVIYPDEAEVISERQD